jgi:hypothetical protein
MEGAKDVKAGAGQLTGSEWLAHALFLGEVRLRSQPIEVFTDPGGGRCFEVSTWIAPIAGRSTTRIICREPLNCDIIAPNVATDFIR